MNSDSSTSKATALASLTETYTDSEGELDSEPETIERKEPSIESTPNSQSGVPLVSYRAEDEDEAVGEDDEAHAESGQVLYVRPESPVSFHRCLQSLGPNGVFLPPEPPGRCAPALQEKIARLYERKVRDGRDMNASIQMRKDFRNPSIYEKLIAYCGIDELGTNYPPETYDPHSWGPDSYYEELSRRQKEEMDKREREKKTKVEFLTGTAKKPEPRKSKWDVGGTQPVLGVARPLAAVPSAILPPPLASRPTVISAFGTLPKKPAAKP
ncbi:SAP30-binding protein-like [Dermacentor andersoni]|uniref:SAP30-binding protein-like n=1 Tax=Dermacentor andersoni TaxID=34620 RepID=UPI0021558F96|nr:SAP30-binding protein-like [Dermacentor andersoni]